MKKLFSLFLIISILSIYTPYTKFVYADFAGGDGSEGSPYQIENCNQLQDINNDLSSYYVLNNDIDCSATNPDNENFNPSGYWSDEKGFHPIGDTGTPFAGHFDGNHYTIDGLFINRLNDYVGLFSAVDSGSSIINLGLTNVNVSGRDRTGALVGSLSGTVTSVYSTGTVHGDYSVGGLVGNHVNNNSWNNSSPLIYTWNGDKYKYVADVGNLLPKEVTNSVDLASVDKSDLVPKDDKYSIKVSEEYNEIVYFDELSLMTYDHAPRYTVAVPLNRTASTSDVKTVSDNPTNPLVSCTDMYGHDCLDSLKNNDDKWSYKDKSFVNYWIMDFGDLSQATSSIQLLMRGARDYAASARMKAEGTYQQLRTVAVKNANGEWVQIYNKNDLGSDGTPRLRSIDLTGKFLTNDYHVKVGFDTFNANYFAVDTTPQVPVTVHTYHPTKADLSFRGFTEIDNTYYANHNYDKVSSLPVGMFKPQYGNFTKYGDVSPLLESTNNQFVIMKGGDHMDIEFPYEAPADGMERSVVFYNNAVYKHASNDSIDLLGKTVTPLPYIGMTDYTSATNGYPMTEENQNYLNTWNTRVYSGTPKHDRSAGSTIINSYSTADVYGSSHVGGLVGYNEKEIRNSYATGNVESQYWIAGGLVGENMDYGSTGWIHDSYARGNVTGSGSTGGLVGNNYGGLIERSYATGLVTASYHSDYGHGFVGWSNGTINNSFWDTETTGNDNGGGGTGKTTSEMKDIYTFTNQDTPGLENAWDFTGTENNDESTDDIWKIDTGNDGYPYLYWQVYVPAPVISNINASVDGESATITWDTDSTSTSKVLYSLQDSHYTSTVEYDSSPRVQSHSVSLEGLLPCTTYFFKVYSSGAYSNRTTSTSSTFTTEGCSAGASPDEKTTSAVDTGANATTTLDITEGSKYFRVVTPEDFTSTSTSIIIQIKSLDKTTVLGSIGSPDGLNGVGSIVFDVKALINATTTLDSFDIPVTITYHYSDADIAGLDESSLLLYHYHSGSWSALDSCSVDADANTITCTAPNFSIFSLFGHAITTKTRSSGSSVASRVRNLKEQGKVDEANKLIETFPNTFKNKDITINTSLLVSTTTTVTKNYFTRDLKKGFIGDDVFVLQKFLIGKDTGPAAKILMQNGATHFFGNLTNAALIEYQKSKNISPAVGYFGPKTRASIQ